MKLEPAAQSQTRVPLHHHRFRRRFTAAALVKPTAYLIFLLLSYTLGYLSAPSSTQTPSPSRDTTTHMTNLVASVPTSPDHLQPPLPVPVPVPVPFPVPPELDHNLFGTVCAAKPVPSQLVRQTVTHRVFNGTSPWDNFPPPHVSHLLKPNRLKGWGSRGAVFEHLIRKVKPKTIIEVGTFLGASALHMANLTRQLGLPDTQILCVDDFRGWPGFQQDRFKNDLKMVNGDVTLLYQFMQNVVHAGATESVTFLPFSTGSALDKLCEWGIYGDLIEVDAGHDFHSAWSDINRAHKILSPRGGGGGGGGGVLFGHDYLTAADNRGVRRAVNLFARLHNYRVQVHGQHWILQSL